MIIFIWGDSIVHAVELNWGKPLYHKPPPSPISQDAVCQIVCLYRNVWPHSDTIFKVTSFQARKGGLWPPEAKKPQVGSGHYELAMAQCISYQEILVNKNLAENIVRGGPGSRPILVVLRPLLR